LIYNIPREEVDEVTPKIREMMIQPVCGMDIPLEVDYKIENCWKKGD